MNEPRPMEGERTAYSEEKPSYLLMKLPVEMKLRILQCLPRYEIDNLRLVSKQMKKLVDDESRRLPKKTFKRVKIFYNTSTQSYSVELLFPHKKGAVVRSFTRMATKRKADRSTDCAAVPVKTFRCENQLHLREIVNDVVDAVASTSESVNNNNNLFGAHSKDNIPISLFKYLEKLLETTDVNVFCLLELQLTSSLIEWLRTSITSSRTKINRLKIEFCSLEPSAHHSAPSSSTVFKRFLKATSPSEVTLSYIRKVTPEHFDEEFFEIVKNCHLLDINNLTAEGNEDIGRFFKWDSLKALRIPYLCIEEETSVGNIEMRSLISKLVPGVRAIEDWKLHSQQKLKFDVILEDVEHEKLADGDFKVKNFRIRTVDDHISIQKIR